MSIKVPVIFYRMYGHFHRVAEAVADGAKQVPGAEVSLSQVPELVPVDVLKKVGDESSQNGLRKSSDRHG